MREATKSTRFELPPYGKFGYSVDYTATPFTRVERYAGTVRWANVLDEYAPTEDRAGLSTQAQQPTAYLPGRRYAERWNLTPAGRTRGYNGPATRCWSTRTCTATSPAAPAPPTTGARA